MVPVRGQVPMVATAEPARTDGATLLEPQRQWQRLQELPTTPTVRMQVAMEGEDSDIGEHMNKLIIAPS